MRKTGGNQFLGLNLTLTAMLGVMAVFFGLALYVAPGAFSPRFLAALRPDLPVCTTSPAAAPRRVRAMPSGINPIAVPPHCRFLEKLVSPPSTAVPAARQAASRAKSGCWMGRTRATSFSRARSW